MTRWLQVYNNPDVFISVTRSEIFPDNYYFRAKGSFTPNDSIGRGLLHEVKIDGSVIFDIRSVAFPAIGSATRSIFIGGDDKNREKWEQSRMMTERDRVWGNILPYLVKLCNKPEKNQLTTTL